MIDDVMTRVQPYIGIPFKTASFNKEEGLDCLTFIIVFMNEILNKNIPTSIVPVYDKNWLYDANMVDIYSKGIREYCDIKIYKDASVLRLYDLVFFSYHSDINKITHAAIYIGKGKIIHSVENYGVIVQNIAFIKNKILLYGNVR